MQDQMTVTTAFKELTANIENVESKPYMRGTLHAALVGLDFSPAVAEEKLAEVYGPRTIQ